MIDDNNKTEYIEPEILEESEDDKEEKVITVYNRAKAIRIIAIETFAFILLITATIAWFSMGKEDKTSDLILNSDSIDFELKTVGYYGYYDDWLDSETAKIADNRASAAAPPSGQSGTLTTDTSASIQWLVTDDSHMKNYVTGSMSEDDIGIRPGTSGQLTFSVVPKSTEDIIIRFKLNIIPYRAVYQMQSGTNIPVTDEHGNFIELDPVQITEDIDAITYMKNHILFFKRRTGTPGNYVYSDLIPLDEIFELVYIPGEGDTPGTYSNILTFAKSGDDLLEKEITIYWIWPETLAEAVLKANQQVESGKRPVCGSENEEIFNKLKSNPGAYLKGYNAATDTNGTADEDLTQAIIKTHYSKLSLEYNNADQEIGDSIGYFVLQLTAIGE